MPSTNGHNDELADIRRERDELREKVMKIEQAVMAFVDIASNYMAATRAVRAGLSSGSRDISTLADRADEAERHLERIIILARQHGLFGEETK